VPDTTEIKIDPVKNTLIRDGVPSILNPFDGYALEAAARIKDEDPSTRIIVLTMGPPQAEKVLRECLSIAADAAYLVSGRTFGGSDTLATSRVLAAAIARLAEKEELAVVFCGKQTIDGDTAQVGPGIATHLGLQQLTLVDRIESFDAQGRRIRVRRRLEDRQEIVEAPLPVLITVVRELNRPRYPTVPARLAAAKAKLEIWDNQVLCLDTAQVGFKGSPTAVRRIFSPEQKPGEILGDGLRDPEAAVDLLMRRLRERELLQSPFDGSGGQS